jgi:hypothetical protein
MCFWLAMNRRSAVSSVALILLYACAGHRPASDAGEEDAAHHGSATDADVEEDAREPLDAAVPVDAALGDATSADARVEASDAAAMKLALVAPGRARISVWDRKICALDAQRDVVCWGAARDAAAVQRSYTPLRGPFRSVERCGSTAFAPVCALRDDGSLVCSNWDGGLSGFLDDPQDCVPQVSYTAFSCGSWGANEIAVLETQGAVARLSETCDVFVEGAQTAPYVRVEMVDNEICALERAGKLHCFASQRLPDGGLPPEAPIVDDVYIDVAKNEIATCAVTREGRVRCWNYLGVEANAKDSFASTASALSAKVARLASASEGGQTLCALLEDGRAGCSASFETGAIRMLGNDLWSEIATDGEAVCGVRVDRTVQCQPLFRTSCSDADCVALKEAIAPPTGLRVPE